MPSVPRADSRQPFDESTRGPRAPRLDDPYRADSSTSRTGRTRRCQRARVRLNEDKRRPPTALRLRQPRPEHPIRRGQTKPRGGASDSGPSTDAGARISTCRAARDRAADRSAKTRKRRRRLRVELIRRGAELQSTHRFDVSGTHRHDGGDRAPDGNHGAMRRPRHLGTDATRGARGPVGAGSRVPRPNPAKNHHTESRHDQVEVFRLERVGLALAQMKAPSRLRCPVPLTTQSAQKLR
jgi:hypothetical protein